MSQILDIQIENYRESLKLVQRAIFYGLLVAGIVFYLSYAEGTKNLPKVPFLSVEFSSLEALQVVLLCLYLGTGIVSLFAILKAYRNLLYIKDNDIAIALSKYPCLVVTNYWFGSLLAGGLLGIGAILLMSIFHFDNIYQKSFYFIVAIPYWATLKVGSKINDWDKNESS